MTQYHTHAVSDNKQERCSVDLVETTDPNELAEHFLEYADAGQLARWRDTWFVFTGQCYREMTAEALDATLRAHLRSLWTWRRERGGKVVEPRRKRKLRPTTHMVNEVRAALPSLGTLLDREREAPFRISDDSPVERDILVCSNGIVDLENSSVQSTTADLFATTALPFAFDPMAKTPDAWLAFLSDIWEGDIASIGTLQEWFGYCLTPWTALQKMLLVVGPKRSGKGTIARILNALLGPRNICGPTLGSLSTQFGLQSWLGKMLAVMSDARLSNRADQSLVVENLLRVSGEDFIEVQRKHKPSVQVQLPTRVLLISNELPRMADTSGALAGRFVTLKLTKSFYGHEDTTLTKRLLEELPGILNWALEGRRRLKSHGAFVQPESAAEASREMEDLASPVGAFVREECQVGQGLSIPVDDLWDAWKAWCESIGKERFGHKNTFSRDLKAVAPSVETTQRQLSRHRFREFQGIAIRS